MAYQRSSSWEKQHDQNVRQVADLAQLWMDENDARIKRAYFEDLKTAIARMAASERQLKKER